MPTPPRQQSTPPIHGSATLSRQSDAKEYDGDSILPRGPQLFRILTFAAAGMAALLALFPPVGHDQLWCLYVAQRMMAGAKLYGPQLFESNPPLIMWASLVLAHLSGLTHVPITVLFKMAVAGLEVGSAWLSLTILRRVFPGIGSTAKWFLAFAFVVVFAVMPARDFGQRDHLLVVLCLPYVLAGALEITRTGRGLSTGLRFSLGFAAAIGICLKPHNGLLVVTTECLVLAFAVKPRRWMPRLELLTIVAAGGGYLLAVRALTPDYLTQVVPLLRDVYWAIGHLGPLQLVGESVQLHGLLLVAVIVLVRIGWRSHPLFTFLLAAGVASTVAYYAQGTGWYYQQIPGLSFLVAGMVVLLIPVVDGEVRVLHSVITTRAAFGLSVLALALTAHFTGYPFIPSRSFPIDAPDEAFFAGLAPGTPVAILTTSVDDTVMPTAKYHLLWAQRTNNLWILPALLRNESGPRPRHVIPPARLAELEELQQRFMVEDLNRWHPALVLVNRCQDTKVPCQVIEDRHDDLLAWFGRDPDFRAAFAPYRFSRSIGDFDAYTLP